MATSIHFSSFSAFILCSIMTGCIYYENDPIKYPEPEVPNATATLEANFVSIAPNKISSSYWKTADYLPITTQNNITQQISAEEGLFNTSGTFNGLTDFNLGNEPKLTLKAAYTEDSLYILVSWKDTTFNVSQSNWFYNGPQDPKKAGSTTGWTSQQASDNLIISFDLGSGKSDIWNWSLALSEPLGYAIDMFNNGAGSIADTGDKTYKRNAIGDNRSGPAFEWDGVQQELTRTPAGFTILDPAYYLLNKKAIDGDIVAGETIYQAECAGCHGTTGDGEGTLNPVGIRLNKPGQFNRLTLSALNAFASDVSQHEGSGHYPISDTDREDLFAMLRGFSGTPGYYLENPTGSNSDVNAVSNVILAKIDGKNSKGYTVLLVRALNTGEADDMIFTPLTQSLYNFNINLMDNDVINTIGSSNEQITFKPQQ